ncbi:MAG: hypothetical protein JWN39_2699 [Ilumatobacteraceae bacterium]|nr:hypothetical protein [Ilumatobacteraceae bacterium]
MLGCDSDGACQRNDVCRRRCVHTEHLPTSRDWLQGFSLPKRRVVTSIEVEVASVASGSAIEVAPTAHGWIDVAEHLHDDSAEAAQIMGRSLCRPIALQHRATVRPGEREQNGDGSRTEPS